MARGDTGSSRAFHRTRQMVSTERPMPCDKFILELFDNYLMTGVFAKNHILFNCK